VFLTTHYLDEADVLCDRLAIIDHGTIVVEGTPEELKRRIAGDVVTVGVPDQGEAVLALVQAQPFVREASRDDGLVRAYVDKGETALPALLRALDAQGLAPETLSLNRPSLDDVFLRQTGRSLRDAA
jgi:ABC-2 type transport system ATP-binding protein